MSDCYCPLIFKGMYVERRDADTSVVAPCCAAVGKSFSNDQINFDTNSFLTRLRKENQSGIASKECEVCWSQEKYTGRSLRTSSLEKYADSLQTPYQLSGLKNLDWNVEPICNAKCIICSNYHSSAWLAEDQKFGDVLFPISRTAATSKQNSMINNLDLSTVERVYFNGGEPVLSQDPVKILQKLSDSGRLDQISVGFNMNGSCMPSDHMIALLKQAANVTVFFSIDGTGPQFEYIRYPLNWEAVTLNINKIMQLGFDQICMTTALGIHNVHIAQATEDWWHNFTKPYADHIQIYNTYQLVVGPLGVDSADASLKNQLLKEFQNATGTVAELVTNCLASCHGDNKWISWLDRLDHRRNLNWRTALPALYQSSQLAGAAK